MPDTRTTKSARKSRIEFKKPDKAKVAEILRLAEIGKNSKIVFHDLANHLTALTLSADRTRQQMEYVANLLRSHIEKDPSVCVCRPAAEIRSICETFRDKADSLSVKISLKLDQEIKFYGSRVALIHIITNLISNALDSFETIEKSREKIVCIVFTKDSAANCQYAQLLVSDSGCGIQSSNISKIFDHGFTTKIHGHGIGLFAVKEYTEKELGGKISVTSSARGTDFLVKIPIQSFTGNKQNRRRNAPPVLLSK